MPRPPIDRRALLAAAGGLATLAAPALSVAGIDTGVIVRTRHGRVRGRRQDAVSVFKGIPYGADTAETRFAPPKPPRPWRGVLEADRWGPVAPQPPDGAPQGYLPVEPEQPRSEDMLKLNVWTPAADRAGRPVLVWLHGGGFSSLSANSLLYDGSNLSAAGDVVVVSLNHRLNLFGFLHAPNGGEAFADSGNAGMLDIVLALQWVRDNIAAFGGDPGKVTLFGHSGGGAKASVLMAMPAARGLFHRVMTISGQQVTVTPSEMAAETTRRVMTQAGLDPADPAALKSLSMRQLITLGRGAYWGPVLDGRSLTRHPFEPDATPLSRDVPLIMGNTHDETRVLIGGANPDLFSLGWDDVPAALTRHIPQFLGALSAEAVVAWYRDLHPSYSPSDVFFAATTALRSWRAQVIQADRRAAQPGARTWVYQFDWKSPAMGGRWGAPHYGDVPFVFGNARRVPSMTGGGPETEPLMKSMMSALLNFARTGDPNGAGVPDWPTYDLATRMTMQFDTLSRATADPRGEERRLLALIPYRQPGT
ncbi:MAG: carboxylesterase/lipase family protein [Pseudomonadota bacterium]